MANLPELWRHPSLARAAVGPSALVATGAGVAIGLWARSVVLAVVLGAVGWVGRMTVAAWRDARRRRAQRPRPIRIDPWAFREPWRMYVRQALAAEARYEQAVAATRPGPLHDRLAALGVRVHR